MYPDPGDSQRSGDDGAVQRGANNIFLEILDVDGDEFVQTSSLLRPCDLCRWCSCLLGENDGEASRGGRVITTDTECRRPSTGLETLSKAD